MAEPGTLLLGLSLAGGAFGVGATLLALRSPGDGRWRRAADLFYLTHWAGALGAFLLLVAYFLASALHVRYVWEHTSVHYPWYYKLSGVWAGQEGTLVLWLAATVTFFGLEKRRRAKAQKGGSGELALLAQAFILIFTTALAGHLLAIGAFAPTEPSLLRFSTTMNGRGMAEVLETPFMVIHPPVQFIAYALAALPAAFALSGVVARDEDWIGPAYKWARPAWGFGTFGLGLGGLWAYYVLSFGGYWAWDPVETANLLPWLALTAFMHAGKYRQRFGDFKQASLVLAFLAWWLGVFATFATRSGLWVSVHAFTDPTGRFNPDAAQRLVAILEVSPTSRFFFAMLSAALLLAAALLARFGLEALPPRTRRVARGVAAGGGFAAGFAALAPVPAVSALLEAGHLLAFGRTAVGFGVVLAVLLALPLLYIYLEGSEEDPAGGGGGWTRWIAPRPLMHAAVGLFAVALAVTLLLDLQVLNGMNRALFDVRAPFIVAPLVLVLAVALAQGPLGPRGALALAGTGAGAAAVAVALFPAKWPIALSVPAVAAACVASVVKIAHVCRAGDASSRLKAAGVLLLLSSLLGLVMWSNPPSHLAGRALPGDWALGFLGFGSGAVAFFGAVVTLRRTARSLAVAGAAAGALSAGYGLGALLGLAALALLVSARGEFRGGARGAFTREAARFREAGIYLVHFAVAVGLIGIALTIPTYQPELKDGFVDWPVGDTVQVGDYAFTLTGFSGERGDSGLPGYDRVIGHMDVSRDGKPHGTGKLEFYWKDPPIAHYDPALDIQRGLTMDLYLNPLAFCVEDPCSDAGNWIAAHGDATRFSSTEIKAVTVEITLLPLMTFVWAGLWLMVGGMLLIVLAQRRVGLKEPASRRDPARPATISR